MAKLNRESKLRDKRAVKAARKDARKQASADGVEWPSHFSADEAAADVGEESQPEAQPIT